MRENTIQLLLLCVTHAAAAIRSDCLGCHQPTVNTVSPTFEDISARYMGPADVDKLAFTIKTGRTGII